MASDNRKHTAAWRKANPEKSNEIIASWRARNPEKVREYNRKSSAKHREKNLQRNREYQLKKKYGLSLADKAALAEKQCGCCAICRQLTSEDKLYVDHDHTTGEVRGLLCKFCNWGLGSFRDNPSIMLRAIAYVRVFDGTENSGADAIPNSASGPDDAGTSVTRRAFAAAENSDNADQLNKLEDWINAQISQNGK